jgi:hypothetical protein
MQMNVGQVIELAREWVEIYGSKMPGFCGAHLMGGLNYTAKDSPFPSYKDVDLNILLRDGDGWNVHDVSYKDLILEYGSVNIEEYKSADMVLSDPRLASNLAVKSILSDPTGMLSALHETVALEYPRRKWVLARCDSAKSAAKDTLKELSQANSLSDAFSNLGFLMLDLSGLIAIAGLKPPTHRRSLVLAREVLETWGQADLHEEILKVYGSAHFSRSDVEAYLPICARAFDKAVEVKQTPIPYGFKLQSYVKPYFIDGAKEMIDEGFHREALLWISAGILISTNAIQIDASEEEKPIFLANAYRLLSDLGLTTSEDIESRIQQARALTDRVFKVADTIVSQNSEILE